MSADRHVAADADTDEYDVDGVLAPGVTRLARGTNVLVSGAAMAGTDDVAYDVVARGLERGEHGVIVTPNRSAQRVRKRYDGIDDSRLHVVDCSGTAGSLDDTDRTKHVSSPGDLTGIGIGIAKCTQSIGGGAVDGVRIGMPSMSTILQYPDLNRLFSFVHVLTGRISAAGYLGVFTIDPTVNDERTVNTLAAQFDGVVELRESDGGREARVRGLSAGPEEWSPT